MSTTTTLKPTTLGMTPSFGFGDRLGVATPGHLAALQQAGGGIAGIFAQQSIREMARTRRDPTQVMTAAADALASAGYAHPWGADADHLKTPQDVDYTANAGFVFFTIDPSDHVDQKADDYSPAEVEQRYTAQPWVEAYLDRTIAIEGGPTIRFDALTVKRAAVKYGKVIAHALQLADHIRHAADQRNQPHEIEISVDETSQPTTLAEHYIIADQLMRAGVNLVSLAPRFIGDLEKGVDYKGDLGKLDESLKDHAAVARQLGPYKLSLHSGSDKLSIYTPFARATGGLFHVKTAGTSYLEALRVVARHEPKLFRKIIDFSRGLYDRDKATYHVSATTGGVPAPEEVRSDLELEKLYLERWADVPQGKGFTEPGRQILHCTFGSVLTDATLGGEVRAVLAAHPDTYTDMLCEHFARHLSALVAGM